MSKNQVGKTGNSAQRAALAAEVYKLRLKGATYKEIGAEFGFSYETSRRLVTEYIESLVVPLAEQMRKVEDDKLNRVDAVCWKLLEDNHVAFQHGKVVSHDGKPIKDTEPVYKAVDRIIKTSESRRRLWGLDTPVKTEHVVTTTTPLDANIANMMEQLKANDAKQAQETVE
ncbi:hypothetical protein ACPYPG_08265 [Streptomyces sp. FR-108]|uniref:hypothetical protein n=1 Tax=Streptomyces sp. FR-108 TaxID=3416665 RepID=UPI003CFB5377